MDQKQGYDRIPVSYRNMTFSCSVMFSPNLNRIVINGCVTPILLREYKWESVLMDYICAIDYWLSLPIKER
jgi:hypothetical protein